MAKARMLHEKISVSIQVNKLSLPAKLLFTWMIAHADDEGRLRGEPVYIKAVVVPMTKWSFKKIERCLEEIKNAGLIYRWEQNGEWSIEFVKWNKHQSIRKDRFIPSNLPSFSKDDGNQSTTKSQPNDKQEDTQSNISKSNVIEVNTSEYKEKQPINTVNKEKEIKKENNKSKTYSSKRGIEGLRETMFILDLKKK